MMPEPVVEGEDPESFMISIQNEVLFFSVNTRSGSESHQTPKRTIVRYERLSQNWRCASCPKQMYAILFESANIQ
jgi:hypothetical protein